MPSRVRTSAATAILAAAILAATDFPSSAQSAATGEVLDTIIGSTVEEEQVDSAASVDQVVKAIDEAPQATEMVRKISHIDKVEIVFVTDASAAEGGPPPAIAEKIKQKSAEVAELRKELEGNAMLFHAIDSRQILVNSVLGVSFDTPGSVIIYAAAKPAKNPG